MGISLDMIEERMDWSNPTIMIREDRFLLWQTTCTTIKQAGDNSKRRWLATTKSKSVKAFNDGLTAVIMSAGAADWRRTYLDKQQVEYREFAKKYFKAVGVQ